jgi:hypothetical protein
MAVQEIAGLRQDAPLVPGFRRDLPVHDISVRKCGTERDRAACFRAATMALRDMEHDRPRLEKGEIAFFIGWHLSERMGRTVRGSFISVNERRRTS